MSGTYLKFAVVPDDIREKYLARDYKLPPEFDHRSRHLSVPRVESPIANIDPYAHLDAHVEPYEAFTPETTDD